MASAQSGHVERLPSGSLRVSVFAGKDPLTGKQLWHRKTVRTEREAQIALARLLEEAEAGRRPATRVTVAEAITRYMEVTQLDLSTRRTYEGYIARTTLPALGSMELRKVRGPLLDAFYARLRRCGARTIRDAIRSGQLLRGEQLPSTQEMSQLYGLRLATTRHALAALAEQGLSRSSRDAVLSSGLGLRAGRHPRHRAHRCGPSTTVRGFAAGRTRASQWRH